MPGIKRRPVDNRLEKNIITAMITNDEFLKNLKPYLRSEFFDIDYLRKIGKWIMSHYEEYETAPKEHMQDIFEEKRPNLEENEANIIEDFLNGLSENYATGRFNQEYLVSKTKHFFNKRNYEILAEKIQKTVGKDKLLPLKKLINEFDEIASTTSDWSDVLAGEGLVNEEDDSSNLFVYPGAVGELIGPFKRGWLVAVMGPMKRGKSFWLLSMALQSVMKKLNTVFISLEMTKQDTMQRIARYVTSNENPTGQEARRRLGMWARHYGKGRFTLLTYPCFSRTMDDIDTDILYMERVAHFTPDVIVIDYADILADTHKSDSERNRLDQIWKRLKLMATQKNALVVTASQTNRAAIKKDSITMTDTAEDIRKAAHVDCMIGLNQTDLEKENQSMRLNIVVHRHKTFSPFWQVSVETDFSVSNACANSEWYRRDEE